MCTQIATKVAVVGSATAGAGWAPVDEAIVTYDHATHVWLDHAIRIDFAGRGAAATAVELDLASGRALLERLRAVIEAASDA